MRKSTRWSAVACNRVADAPAAGGATSLIRCAAAACPVESDGVLCPDHWRALPWSLRNDAGAGWHAPATVSGRWLRDALAALGGKPAAKTLYNTTPMSRRERALRPAALAVLAEHAEDRPRTRSDCSGGARPCPWVSCKWHLYLDVNPTSGHIKLNFPGQDVSEMRESCALDVAERGGLEASAVGAMVGLRRGRVGQMERRLREAAKDLL